MGVLAIDYQHPHRTLRLFNYSAGTLAVIYLLGFVTYKTAKWGFHMDFTEVPGSCK